MLAENKLPERFYAEEPIDLELPDGTKVKWAEYVKQQAPAPAHDRAPQSFGRGMDLDERAVMASEVVAHVGHSSCNSRRLDFVFNRPARPPDALGIGFDVHLRIERVQTAFERGQFALRVAGDQQHVGRRCRRLHRHVESRCCAAPGQAISANNRINARLS